MSVSGRSVAVSIIFLSGLLTAAEPAAKPTRARKLIEWGWDEPDTMFLRANHETMDRMPFDGFVFHADSKTRRRLSWEAWGKQEFAFEDFGPALEDLSAAKFRRLTDRFLRMNITPGTVDWFDDRAWAVVLKNFGVAARVAKHGGCKGLLFDVEQYEGRPFDYGRLKQKDNRSFVEYQAKVRQRGREWVRTVNAAFPDITIFLSFGYELAQPRPGKDRSTAGYGLLADFLDGILDACSDGTTIVDGFEQAYPYKTAQQFEQAYRTIRESGPGWSAAPEKYRRHVRAAFGLWMDYDWRKKGWDTADVSKNYFRPDAFESAVRSALRVSDEYVWIYTEKPRWWTGQDLPQAYIDAVKRARGEGK